MDDVGGGGSLQDAMRMRGTKLDDGTYDGTVSRILSLGGFKAKTIVVSGICDDEEFESLGGKFLGLPYDPKTDLIGMKLDAKIRVFPKAGKKKGVNREVFDSSMVRDLEAGDLAVTRSTALGFVMAQYDVLGLISPLMVTPKLM